MHVAFIPVQRRLILQQTKTITENHNWSKMQKTIDYGVPIPSCYIYNTTPSLRDQDGKGELKDSKYQRMSKLAVKNVSGHIREAVLTKYQSYVCLNKTLIMKTQNDILIGMERISQR